MTTKEPLSNYARRYLNLTPLGLLDATGAAPTDERFPVEPSEVFDAAMRGLARIMLADGAEQMQFVAEDVRRELVIEFYDRVK